MTRSFRSRLTIAFIAVGVSAAGLTALVVNFAFGSRFDHYLHEQQRSRQGQIVSALEDAYARDGAWSSTSLNSSLSGLLMDGGTVRLLDEGGDELWSISADDPSGHHQAMMGTTGELGPEVILPLDADGATAVLRLPEAGMMPNDVEFRDSMNWLLVAAGGVAAAAAAFAALYLGKTASTSTRALTEAARAMARGDRGRRVLVGSDDEFGEMARAFNTMADSVEEEDRLRKGFAADVAHELRTPLGILQGQIEAIQDGVLPADDRSLASLKDEVIRLSRSVADLEAMAAADAASFSLVVASVRVDEVVADALEDLRGPMEEMGVQLHTELGRAEMDGDATRLHQIVSNLLSNALKFMEPRGSLMVSVVEEGGEIRVSVADDGPGIAAEDLHLIFDRFYRGRNARARGSGIGLSVARELAEAMGGSIEVDSTPGHGSTFTVTFPAAAASPGRGAA